MPRLSRAYPVLWRMCHKPASKGGGGKRGWPQHKAEAKAKVHGKTAYPCPLPVHWGLWHIGGKR